MRNSVAIVGVGYSEVVRRSEKAIGVLAVDAARAAAADAGLDVTEIDGLSVFPSPAMHGGGNAEGVDFVGPSYMVRHLHMRDVRWTCIVEPSSFVSSLVEATNAVAVGACNYALVWRAMHNPAGRFGRFQARVASGATEFIAPYGLSNPGMQNAIAYSRYMALYGARREHMATFVVNNRRNAALNPHAVFFKRPITRDEYINDRPYAMPLSYLDADMAVDGAGAVIVTTAERATALRQRPAYIIGHASLGINTRRSPAHTLEALRDASDYLAAQLWAHTEMKAGDVQQANLYDGFSWFTYLWLEAFGFCGKGEAFEFIQDGRIEQAGELPLNTSGGSLGMGRLHGPPQVIESVLQLQGRAGQRQVDDVHIALAHTGSVFATAGAMLLTDDPTVELSRRA